LTSIQSVFGRSKDPEPMREDMNLVLATLMRIEARLEAIEQVIREEDDGEDQEGS
jgi:hypothetical protein